MKKLVLMLAVAFSVSLFSCGNGEANKAADSVDSTAATTTEVTETVVEETVVEAPADSVPADSTVKA
ncbi:MAG: hypothetical protein K2L80_01930 [Muribaculaceae bacterium]|nr:hypothetical protein [Muribaculaceae bacterium]MDE6331338.1 hypothetical protein [Muribaculaceae bacterium]